jgi:hypothetical protein
VLKTVTKEKRGVPRLTVEHHAERDFFKSSAARGSARIELDGGERVGKRRLIARRPLHDTLHVRAYVVFAVAMPILGPSDPAVHQGDVPAAPGLG